MVLNLAQRGALRQLHVIRTVRAAVPRRGVCLAANSRFSKPIASRIAYPSQGLSRSLISQYATAAGRPKGSTKATRGKKKTKSAKKTVAKKAKKPKKELSEEEKAAKKEKKKLKEQKELVKQLKVTALEKPKKLTENAWPISVQRASRDVDSTAHKDRMEAFKEACEKARNLSEAEKQEIAEIAESNKAENKAAFKKWLQEHTPLQIKEANAARLKLSHITGKKYPMLQDERLVKNPRPAFSLFVAERVEQGDFKNMKMPDVVRQVSQEWKSMDDWQKQKYVDAQTEDNARYRREHLEVYGEEAPAPRTSQSS